jgi:hypothetical protein
MNKGGNELNLNKGDRVRHPLKLEWGMGQVLSETNGEFVKVFFERIGDKSISIQHIELVKVEGEEAQSVILDAINFDDSSSSKDNTLVCKNCGQKTNFGSMSYTERSTLGWCSACYKNRGISPDHVPTIDGPKNYFQKK